MPLLLIATGAFFVLAMVVFAFAGPSPDRARARRLGAVQARHGHKAPVAEAQMRSISSARTASKTETAFGRLLPNPAQLAKRLAMTGKDWTVGQYGMASAGLFAVISILLMLKGAPLLLAIFIGLVVGAGIPHKAVGFLIKRRIAKFTAKFPDAIELLVRGLRSGLPVTETISVVGQEVEGPVGEEFRTVTDKMKIGTSMDSALQDTADRLGT
ncbi:MAG: type II secretion system F family protein, partial [Sphingomonas bacterium]|nr:type II secretion system F family protein [Sphingomonas bacterium]